MAEDVSGGRTVGDSLDGRYIVSNDRSEPALCTLVSLRHEITTYIDREGDVVTLHNTEEAGSGFGFLLRAWVSLHDGRALDLRGVQMLDSMSMVAFDAMLRTYCIGPDLEAWHRTPQRQEWTRMLVHVATQASGARAQATEAPLRVVDIGCGAGHDLRALDAALPGVCLAGVEPNEALRCAVQDHLIPCYADITQVDVERADLLVCIDVLEHVPDPASFLGSLAQRAPVGCLLFETTATHDCGTPLHLAANRGWHPGRVLERHGWELADQTGRVRVWRRVCEAGGELDDEQSCALLDYLDAINPPKGHDCWRELVNGRWCVFMTYGGQTYCLLPLSYSTPATGCLPE